MREAWAAEAYRRLAEHGYRTGGARQEVIEFLAREGGCLTAAEMLSRLNAGSRRASAASVYRALATLRELNLIRAFDHGEGTFRYELDDPAGAHHHHLICEGCGTTEPFNDARLELAISDVAAERRYQLAAHEVVLFGRCSSCVRSAA